MLNVIYSGVFTYQQSQKRLISPVGIFQSLPGYFQITVLSTTKKARITHLFTLPF